MQQTIKAILKNNGVKPKDILYYAATDMNPEGTYQDGVLVLTTDTLYCFLSLAPQPPVRYFKGYGTRRERADGEGQAGEWAVKPYPLQEIEALWMEPQVACSLLLAKIEGVDRRLAVLSNLHKKRVHGLVRCWEQQKNPTPGITLEDLQKELREEERAYCPKCGRMYPDPARKLCPHCTDRGSVFVRTLRYLKPYRGKLAIMILCILLASFLNLLWPYLNGTVLYDRVLAKDPAFLQTIGMAGGSFVVALLLLVLTMFAAKLVLLVLQIVQSALTAQITPSLVRDMKEDIFSVMGRLSIGFFRSRQTGSLMTRVMSDADQITGFFFDDAPYIIVYALTILTSVVVMLRINWQMTLVTVLLLPVLTAISVYLRPRIWVMFGRRHRAERSVNSTVNDNLTGARVVKAFGQEALEIDRFDTPNKRLQSAEIGISFQQNAFQVIWEGAQEIAVMAIWAIGVFFILRGEQSLGTLITFVGYAGQLNRPMRFMARLYNHWTRSMNSAQRMFEIIDSIPEIEEAEHPIPLENPRGDVELRHVTFGYEVNRPVLRDVSLTIPAGSLLGIVGRSGAGKTTIVNLISRMYEVEEGAIFLDGINIKDLSFHDLRGNVAMVSQETYIFMGTVADNIAYARPDATRLEIMRAAKLAGAHEFIMRMPDGYDTRLGSGGRTLSGGESQRVSIARAILADPKILILDEATASVDTETERVIQKSIQYLVRGRTTISIAHRLSTLRDADSLAVIDNGRITERGTHAELEALHGTYYKLMQLQKKALDLKEEGEI